MIYRTQVYKWHGKWWTQYYMPYSGILIVDFDTWRDAIEQAFSVEKQKEYM